MSNWITNNIFWISPVVTAGKVTKKDTKFLTMKLYSERRNKVTPIKLYHVASISWPSCCGVLSGATSVFFQLIPGNHQNTILTNNWTLETSGERTSYLMFSSLSGLQKVFFVVWLTHIGINTSFGDSHDSNNLVIDCMVETCMTVISITGNTSLLQAKQTSAEY